MKLVPPNAHFDAAPQEIRDLAAGCPGQNPLARDYQDFKVQDRVLLTGHSHQAWPDCAKQGLLCAYQDAAAHVDDKWSRAQAKAKQVQRGFASLLEDPHGEYVLGQNVHELMLRWFSSLPAYTSARGLARPAPILTSDGEFHSVRRQLARWEEYGIEVQRVAHSPQMVPALIEALEARPPGSFGAVLVSCVGYLRGLWVQELPLLAQAAAQAKTPLLIDAYHAINVRPFCVQELGLEQAYVVGGGYKYCQLGEGVCFLRIPADSAMRPAITGWFAEFEGRDQDQKNQVSYARGAGAFAGATYDPASHYRAARVFEFFQTRGLSLPLLSAISQRQLQRLLDAFSALGQPRERIALADEVPLETRAGFLAFRTPHAQELCEKLRKKDIWVDARGEILRLGPAPYLSDPQLDQAIASLDHCLNAI